MPALRPLAPRPSLEFDRKAAKALLRSLKAHDPGAVARARAHHPGLDLSNPGDTRLADAQHIIAREYGFASWPRLVHYYAGVERQRYADKRQSPLAWYERSVKNLLAEHASKREMAGRALAAYVPRFYGMRVDEVFSLTVTEDEARLAVARVNGCPSWEVLHEPTATLMDEHEDPWTPPPTQQAFAAIRRADLPALQELVRQHPTLRGGADACGTRHGFSLSRMALQAATDVGHDVLQPIQTWLATHGEDLQADLNEALCGRMHVKPDEVRSLLAAGADASWIAPNGIPVLEYALLRYWSGEAVDVLASRTVPRKALWISAGLGDIAGVRGFLDRHGKPTQAARLRRPPFDAVAPRMMPPALPDADDDEILFEAFWVALLNGRANVIEYLVSRGFNVDYLLLGDPASWFAAANGMATSLACLVQCGANLDLRGAQRQSAREVAREQFLNGAHAPGFWEPTLEICGLDPAAILAEHDATPRAAPAMGEDVMQAVALAGDDARRQGDAEIRAENLLYGQLRAGEGRLVHFFKYVKGLEFEPFTAHVMSRVRPDDGTVPPSSSPQHPEIAAVLAAATQLASEHRREMVNGSHVLAVMLRDKHGAAAILLERFGGSVAEMEKVLSDWL